LTVAGTVPTASTRYIFCKDRVNELLDRTVDGRRQTIDGLPSASGESPSS
jgi:hypothetical protein